MSSKHQLGFSDLVFRQLSGKLELGIPIEEVLQQMDRVQEKMKEWQSPVEGPGNEGNTYFPIIQKAACEYDLDPFLIQAVIQQESNGNPDAISSKGAKGLMQLIDSTAEILGVENSFDPEENIMGGTQYLKDMLNQFIKQINFWVSYIKLYHMQAYQREHCL